jgi:hypothetical protein
MEMNGPQLKAVLERAYRNYYYYKYVSGYGGYSYYTTCMLDTNAGNQIVYKDTYPILPDGNNVLGLVIQGVPVDLNDASKYYRVSTVNYLAAGSCNFNDNGVSLWPLNQIVADTQYYVRDAVINYATAMGTIAPHVEGRLAFMTLPDTDAPVITINSPTATTYLHPDSLTLDFSAVDAGVGLKSVTGTLGGASVSSGQVIDLHTLNLGNHTLAVTAVDWYGNSASASVTFKVNATIDSLITSLKRVYDEGAIKNRAIYRSLLNKLETAKKATKVKVKILSLTAFILEVKVLSHKFITREAATLLMRDATWVIAHLK